MKQALTTSRACRTLLYTALEQYKTAVSNANSNAAGQLQVQPPPPPNTPPQAVEAMRNAKHSAFEEF